MKSWRLWLPAVAVLLLGMDGVYMEDMRAENIDLLTPTDYNRVLNLGMRVLPRDCYDMLMTSSGKARDGVYLIQPGDAPIVAFCAMQEGGWTVFQHITVNSSVDFDRTWDEYKNGFGDVTGDHWLGNKYLHQLTLGPAHYKLGVKLVDRDAVTKTGEYDPFLVEDESTAFRLRLGLFQGTAVDALTMDTENYLHDNQKFTTKDRDNDNYFQNCAKLEFQGVPGGGWWYDACAGANLNRRNVIYWQKDCNKEHLCKYAWMMVHVHALVCILTDADAALDARYMMFRLPPHQDFQLPFICFTGNQTSVKAQMQTLAKRILSCNK
uniref:Zgc:194887 n=1 Tax=Oryzias melastigma TaxID=30732 RepID=A0A3B3CJX7_ORYME